jgi:hypothetical protein
MAHPFGDIPVLTESTRKEVCSENVKSLYVKIRPPKLMPRGLKGGIWRKEPSW